MKEDLEDVGSRFDGAPDLEFRLATDELELEKSGLSYQRVPPGYRFPYGHTHKTQEEVYVVVRGSGRMKLDDEIVELKEWDAVRVPPGTWRGYEAGDRKSTRLNSSHLVISYAVFCLKKKKTKPCALAYFAHEEKSACCAGGTKATHRESWDRSTLGTPTYRDLASTPKLHRLRRLLPG